MPPPDRFAGTVGRGLAFRARGGRANGAGRYRLSPAFGKQQPSHPAPHVVFHSDFERIQSDAIHVTNWQVSYNPDTHCGLLSRFT